MPHQELGYGTEAVAHAVDVSALCAQDARERVSETLNFQQKDVVKRVLHVGQLVHQIHQALPGLLLDNTRRQKETTKQTNATFAHARRVVCMLGTRGHVCMLLMKALSLGNGGTP